MSAFRIHAVPPTTLTRIRARGVDDFGNNVRTLVNTEEQGAPLRCCLREAAVGEDIVLIAYRPAQQGGAYAEIGPIFIHPHECGGYTSTDQYPPAFRHRRQLLRAYDHRGDQRSNTLIEGAQAAIQLTALLADPQVDVVHSRNPLAGCFMFTVTRPPND